MVRDKDDKTGERMKNDVMFSSRTDMWETPQDFFDELNSEFHFTLDVCAVPENAKCEKFYTPDDDGLSQPWDGVVWCNPPIWKGHRKMDTYGIDSIRSKRRNGCYAVARPD